MDLTGTILQLGSSTQLDVNASRVREFRYADLVYGVQIVSITYSKNTTTIQGRML